MNRFSNRLFQASLWMSSSLTYVFLYLPIAVLILYSFSAARYGGLSDSTSGYSFEWYIRIFENTLLLESLGNSLIIAFATALLSTALGVGVAIALQRYPWRHKAALNAAVILPILVPEIVMGIALLFFFARLLRPFLGVFDLELGPIESVTFGHVAFNLSYVVVMARARLVDCGETYEEAARSLGANEWQVLRHVTLPLLKPALISSVLLTFTLSLDDFYLSYFSSGGGNGFRTLPLHLFALQAKAGVTPEMNAIASLMLLVSLALVSVAMYINRRTHLT